METSIRLIINIYDDTSQKNMAQKLGSSRVRPNIFLFDRYCINRVKGLLYFPIVKNRHTCQTNRQIRHIIIYELNIIILHT